MTLLSKFDGDCKDTLHPWTTSCSFAALELFYHIFRTSFKIYGSIYLIAALARRKDVEYLKKKLLREIVQSTVFLSLNGSLFAVCLCTHRKVLGTFTVLTSALLPAVIASYIAIISERPQRRGLLALYMFNNAIEGLFNMLVSRNIVKTVPYGEVYMFCSATAALMYLYREKKLSNAFLTKVLKFLLGEDKTPGNTLDTTSFLNFYNSSSLRDFFKRLIPSFKAFFIGYLGEAVPGVLRCLFQPTKIPRALVRKNNFKLGLFLSSFVGLFQFVEFLLKLIRKKTDSLNSLVAGGASGLSILFYRSSTISLYLFTKVAEILYKNAQNEGLLPTIPYAEIIIYSISTAITFHMCVFEPHNVRPGYWKFLNHITNNRFCECDRTRIPEHFGFNSTTFFPPGDLYHSLRALRK